MRSIDFMRGLPARMRETLPAEWRGFKTAMRPWLFQLYFRDPSIHYEVANLGDRRGLLEVGYHFESRDRALNQRLLTYYLQHLVAIKTTLGDGWEAEPWDRGWTKVYTTLPRAAMAADLQDAAVATLTQAIVTLEPMLPDWATA